MSEQPHTRSSSNIPKLEQSTNPNVQNQTQPIGSLPANQLNAQNRQPAQPASLQPMAKNGTHSPFMYVSSPGSSLHLPNQPNLPLTAQPSTSNNQPASSSMFSPMLPATSFRYPSAWAPAPIGTQSHSSSSLLEGSKSIQAQLPTNSTISPRFNHNSPLLSASHPFHPHNTLNTSFSLRNTPLPSAQLPAQRQSISHHLPSTLPAATSSVNSLSPHNSIIHSSTNNPTNVPPQRSGGSSKPSGLPPFNSLGTATFPYSGTASLSSFSHANAVGTSSFVAAGLGNSTTTTTSGSGSGGAAPIPAPPSSITPFSLFPVPAPPNALQPNLLPSATLQPPPPPPNRPDNNSRQTTVHRPSENALNLGLQSNISTNSNLSLGSTFPLFAPPSKSNINISPWKSVMFPGPSASSSSTTTSLNFGAPPPPNAPTATASAHVNPATHNNALMLGTSSITAGTSSVSMSTNVPTASAINIGTSSMTSSMTSSIRPYESPRAGFSHQFTAAATSLDMGGGSVDVSPVRSTSAIQPATTTTVAAAAVQTPKPKKPLHPSTASLTSPFGENIFQSPQQHQYQPPQQPLPPPNNHHLHHPSTKFDLSHHDLQYQQQQYQQQQYQQQQQQYQQQQQQYQQRQRQQQQQQQQQPQLTQQQQQLLQQLENHPSLPIPVSQRSASIAAGMFGESCLKWIDSQKPLSIDPNIYLQLADAAAHTSSSTSSSLSLSSTSSSLQGPPWNGPSSHESPFSGIGVVTANSSSSASIGGGGLLSPHAYSPPTMGPVSSPMGGSSFPSLESSYHQPQPQHCIPAATHIDLYHNNAILQQIQRSIATCANIAEQEFLFNFVLYPDLIANHIHPSILNLFGYYPPEARIIHDPLLEIIPRISFRNTKLASGTSNMISQVSLPYDQLSSFHSPRQTLFDTFLSPYSDKHGQLEPFHDIFRHPQTKLHDVRQDDSARNNSSTIAAVSSCDQPQLEKNGETCLNNDNHHTDNNDAADDDDDDDDGIVNPLNNNNTNDVYLSRDCGMAHDTVAPLGHPVPLIDILLQNRFNPLDPSRYSQDDAEFDPHLSILPGTSLLPTSIYLHNNLPYASKYSSSIHTNMLKTQVSLQQQQQLFNQTYLHYQSTSLDPNTAADYLDPTSRSLTEHLASASSPAAAVFSQDQLTRFIPSSTMQLHLSTNALPPHSIHVSHLLSQEHIISQHNQPQKITSMVNGLDFFAYSAVVGHIYLPSYTPSTLLPVIPFPVMLPTDTTVRRVQQLDETTVGSKFYADDFDDVRSTTGSTTTTGSATVNNPARIKGLRTCAARLTTYVQDLQAANFNFLTEQICREVAYDDRENTLPPLRANGQLFSTGDIPMPSALDKNIRRRIYDARGVLAGSGCIDAPKAVHWCGQPDANFIERLLQWETLTQVILPIDGVSQTEHGELRFAGGVQSSGQTSAAAALPMALSKQDNNLNSIAEGEDISGGNSMSDHSETSPTADAGAVPPKKPRFVLRRSVTLVLDSQQQPTPTQQESSMNDDKSDIPLDTIARSSTDAMRTVTPPITTTTTSASLIAASQPNMFEQDSPFVKSEALHLAATQDVFRQHGSAQSQNQPYDGLLSSTASFSEADDLLSPHLITPSATQLQSSSSSITSTTQLSSSLTTMHNSSVQNSTTSSVVFTSAHIRSPPTISRASTYAPVATVLTPQHVLPPLLQQQIESNASPEQVQDLWESAQAVWNLELASRLEPVHLRSLRWQYRHYGRIINTYDCEVLRTKLLSVISFIQQQLLTLMNIEKLLQINQTYDEQPAFGAFSSRVMDAVTLARDVIGQTGKLVDTRVIRGMLAHGGVFASQGDDHTIDIAKSAVKNIPRPSKIRQKRRANKRARAKAHNVHQVRAHDTVIIDQLTTETKPSVPNTSTFLPTDSSPKPPTKHLLSHNTQDIDPTSAIPAAKRARALPTVASSGVGANAGAVVRLPSQSLVQLLHPPASPAPMNDLFTKTPSFSLPPPPPSSTARVSSSSITETIGTSPAAVAMPSFSKGPSATTSYPLLSSRKLVRPSTRLGSMPELQTQSIAYRHKFRQFCQLFQNAPRSKWHSYDRLSSTVAQCNRSQAQQKLLDLFSYFLPVGYDLAHEHRALATLPRLHHLGLPFATVVKMMGATSQLINNEESYITPEQLQLLESKIAQGAQSFQRHPIRHPDNNSPLSHSEHGPEFSSSSSSLSISLSSSSVITSPPSAPTASTSPPLDQNSLDSTLVLSPLVLPSSPSRYASATTASAVIPTTSSFFSNSESQDAHALHSLEMAAALFSQTNDAFSQSQRPSQSSQRGGAGGSQSANENTAMTGASSAALLSQEMESTQQALASQSTQPIDEASATTTEPVPDSMSCDDNDNKQLPDEPAGMVSPLVVGNQPSSNQPSSITTTSAVDTVTDATAANSPVTAAESASPSESGLHTPVERSCPPPASPAFHIPIVSLPTVVNVPPSSLPSSPRRQRICAIPSQNNVNELVHDIAQITTGTSGYSDLMMLPQGEIVLKHNDDGLYHKALRRQAPRPPSPVSVVSILQAQIDSEPFSEFDALLLPHLPPTVTAQRLLHQPLPFQRHDLASSELPAIDRPYLKLLAATCPLFPSAFQRMMKQMERKAAPKSTKYFARLFFTRAFGAHAAARSRAINSTGQHDFGYQIALSIFSRFAPVRRVALSSKSKSQDAADFENSSEQNIESFLSTHEKRPGNAFPSLGTVGSFLSPSAFAATRSNSEINHALDEVDEYIVPPSQKPDLLTIEIAQLHSSTRALPAATINAFAQQLETLADKIDPPSDSTTPSDSSSHMDESPSGRSIEGESLSSSSFPNVNAQHLPVPFVSAHKHPMPDVVASRFTANSIEFPSRSSLLRRPSMSTTTMMATTTTMSDSSSDQNNSTTDQDDFFTVTIPVQSSRFLPFHKLVPSPMTRSHRNIRHAAVSTSLISSAAELIGTSSIFPPPTHQLTSLDAVQHRRSTPDNPQMEFSAHSPFGKPLLPQVGSKLAPAAAPPTTTATTTDSSKTTSTTNPTTTTTTISNSSSFFTTATPSKSVFATVTGGALPSAGFNSVSPKTHTPALSYSAAGTDHMASSSTAAAATGLQIESFYTSNNQASGSNTSSAPFQPTSFTGISSPDPSAARTITTSHDITSPIASFGHTRSNSGGTGGAAVMPLVSSSLPIPSSLGDIDDDSSTLSPPECTPEDSKSAAPSEPILEPELPMRDGLIDFFSLFGKLHNTLPSDAAHATLGAPEILPSGALLEDQLANQHPRGMMRGTFTEYKAAYVPGLIEPRVEDFVVPFIPPEIVLQASQPQQQQQQSSHTKRIPTTPITSDLHSHSAAPGLSQPQSLQNSQKPPQTPGYQMSSVADSMETPTGTTTHPTPTSNNQLELLTQKMRIQQKNPPPQDVSSTQHVSSTFNPVYPTGVLAALNKAYIPEKEEYYGDVRIEAAHINIAQWESMLALHREQFYEARFGIPYPSSQDPSAEFIFSDDYYDDEIDRCRQLEQNATTASLSEQHQRRAGEILDEFYATPPFDMIGKEIEPETIDDNTLEEPDSNLVSLSSSSSSSVSFISPSSTSVPLTLPTSTAQSTTLLLPEFSTKARLSHKEPNLIPDSRLMTTIPGYHADPIDWVNPCETLPVDYKTVETEQPPVEAIHPSISKKPWVADDQLLMYDPTAIRQQFRRIDPSNKQKSAQGFAHVVDDPSCHPNNAAIVSYQLAAYPAPHLDSIPGSGFITIVAAAPPFSQRQKKSVSTRLRPFAGSLANAERAVQTAVLPDSTVLQYDLTQMAMDAVKIETEMINLEQQLASVDAQLEALAQSAPNINKEAQRRAREAQSTQRGRVVSPDDTVDTQYDEYLQATEQLETQKRQLLKQKLYFDHLEKQLNAASFINPLHVEFRGERDPVYGPLFEGMLYAPLSWMHSAVTTTPNDNTNHPTTQTSTAVVSQSPSSLKLTTNIIPMTVRSAFRNHPSLLSFIERTMLTHSYLPPVIVPLDVVSQTLERRIQHQRGSKTVRFHEPGIFDGIPAPPQVAVMENQYIDFEGGWLIQETIIEARDGASLTIFSDETVFAHLDLGPTFLVDSMLSRRSNQTIEDQMFEKSCLGQKVQDTSKLCVGTAPNSTPDFLQTLLQGTQSPSSTPTSEVAHISNLDKLLLQHTHGQEVTLPDPFRYWPVRADIPALTLGNVDAAQQEYARYIASSYCPDAGPSDFNIRCAEATSRAACLDFSRTKSKSRSLSPSHASLERATRRNITKTLQKWLPGQRLAGVLPGWRYNARLEYANQCLLQSQPTFKIPKSLRSSIISQIKQHPSHFAHFVNNTTSREKAIAKRAATAAAAAAAAAAEAAAEAQSEQNDKDAINCPAVADSSTMATFSTVAPSVAAALATVVASRTSSSTSVDHQLPPFLKATSPKTTADKNARARQVDFIHELTDVIPAATYDHLESYLASVSSIHTSASVYHHFASIFQRDMRCALLQGLQDDSILQFISSPNSSSDSNAIPRLSSLPIWRLSACNVNGSEHPLFSFVRDKSPLYVPDSTSTRNGSSDYLSGENAVPTPRTGGKSSTPKSIVVNKTAHIKQNIRQSRQQLSKVMYRSNSHFIAQIDDIDDTSTFQPDFDSPLHPQLVSVGTYDFVTPFTAGIYYSGQFPQSFDFTPSTFFTAQKTAADIVVNSNATNHTFPPRESMLKPPGKQPRQPISSTLNNSSPFSKISFAPTIPLSTHSPSASVSAAVTGNDATVSSSTTTAPALPTKTSSLKNEGFQQFYME